MSGRLRALPPRVALPLVFALLLAYAAAAWLVVVGPKRAEVGRLERELAVAEERLDAARAAATSPRVSPAPVPAQEVVALAKAMPSSADQAGLVLELSALARRSGVVLRSLSPGALSTGAGGATTIPITVSLEGRYADVVRFLRLARDLVSVRGDRVTARGRLLVARSVELAASRASGFPQLEATVAFDAYVYDRPLAVEGEDASEEVGPASQAAGGSTS